MKFQDFNKKKFTDKLQLTAEELARNVCLITIHVFRRHQTRCERGAGVQHK